MGDNLFDMYGRTDGQMDSHHESNTRFTVICVVHDIVHSVVYSKERSFLENLTSFGLSRNFPAMYGIRESITAVTSARHLSLSWDISIQSMIPHPTYWRSILLVSIYCTSS